MDDLVLELEAHDTHSRQKRKEQDVYSEGFAKFVQFNWYNNQCVGMTWSQNWDSAHDGRFKNSKRECVMYDLILKYWKTSTKGFKYAVDYLCDK